MANAAEIQRSAELEAKYKQKKATLCAELEQEKVQFFAVQKQDMENFKSQEHAKIQLEIQAQTSKDMEVYSKEKETQLRKAIQEEYSTALMGDQKKAKADKDQYEQRIHELEQERRCLSLEKQNLELRSSQSSQKLKLMKTQLQAADSALSKAKALISIKTAEIEELTHALDGKVFNPAGNSNVVALMAETEVQKQELQHMKSRLQTAKRREEDLTNEKSQAYNTAKTDHRLELMKSKQDNLQAQLQSANELKDAIRDMNLDLKIQIKATKSSLSSAKRKTAEADILNIKELQDIDSWASLHSAMLTQYHKEVKMTTDLLHRVDIMCEYRRDFVHGLCNILNIKNFLPAATNEAPFITWPEKLRDDLLLEKIQKIIRNNIQDNRSLQKEDRELDATIKDLTVTAEPFTAHHKKCSRRWKKEAAKSKSLLRDHYNLARRLIFLIIKICDTLGIISMNDQAFIDALEADD
ncbi:hypothetical protein GTA08_BOTSDO08235 [Botryosphaeria dothidea]|uniref:Uncharacterized protein n=1 Tax=Botryosphaeria dothidea TaxID=55169 RepID=A0A8H4IMG4_9PEZI|nr:hypothetical protein GTA08_BOTSDO08235 [Botryosphaeria dothidea]